MNTPKERLKSIIPHLKFAAKKASEATGGRPVQLAIVSTNEDGSGHVGAKFFAQDFLDDLEALLEVSDEEKKEGELDASVTHFLQTNGLG